MSTRSIVDSDFRSSPTIRLPILDRVEPLMREFGWQSKGLLSETLLSRPRYGEFLEFLYASRLLFSIRGYEASSQESVSEMRNGIQMVAGAPYLLVNGELMHWNTVLNTFKYDPLLGITAQDSDAPWNYLYPNGLVQRDCCNWIGRVHQLSPAELDRLYTCSQKYLYRRREPTIPKEGCAYVQVITDNDDAGDRIAGHVIIRLIDAVGGVYSLGFQRPKEEASLGKICKLLGTYNAVIISRDYKEFAQFAQRQVTTVPVTRARFPRVLGKAQSLAAIPLRYNFLNQNCVTFTAEILREAGVEIDTRSSSISKMLFYGIAPEGMKKMLRVTGRTLPKEIHSVIGGSADVLTYPLDLLKNVLYRNLGAGKRGASLRTAGEESESSSLASSNSLFQQQCGFLRPQYMDVRYKITEWQMEQGSTETHRYEGPRFYIAKRMKANL